jgi:DNA-binding response OmpR family regulator
MTEKIALVIDDTPANRDFLERLMMMAGFKIVGASSGKAALEQADALETLTIALIDMELPDANGLQLTTDLRKRFPDAYLVVATMHDERALMQSVLEKGGNCFLVKPHGFMELFKRLTTNTMEELLKTPYTVIDHFGPRVFTPLSSSST